MEERSATERRETGAAQALLERHGAVALLRLNRPEKHNAVNEQMSVEARELLDAAEAEDEVRVIVLTGAGSRAFCAGQDMAEATGRVERSTEARGGGAGGLAQRLGECEKPVIAAINGLCYGGGMSVALNCDLRFAAETATFRLPGTQYGLVVSATLLASAIGPAAAKDLLFSARVVDAQEALRIGLAQRLVPAEDLEQVTLAYAQEIAANSPLAIRHTKRVVNAATVLEVALEEERTANRLLRGGPDHTTRFSAAADRVLGRQ
jgi:enoyl-CoA hydratase/carnithine racemase